MSFTRQNTQLNDSILQLIYYFRGALSRDDAWAMSPVEREGAIEFLNKRFEDAGKMIKERVPVFL